MKKKFLLSKLWFAEIFKNMLLSFSEMYPGFKIGGPLDPFLQSFGVQLIYSQLRTLINIWSGPNPHKGWETCKLLINYSLLLTFFFRKRFSTFGVTEITLNPKNLQLSHVRSNQDDDTCQPEINQQCLTKPKLNILLQWVLCHFAHDNKQTNAGIRFEGIQQTQLWQKW